MTPSEHLRLAAALIADEKRWTHGTSARNAAGEPCEPDSPDARQRCAFGALVQASPNDLTYYGTAFKFLKVYGNDMASLNDSAGHAYTIGAMMHVADKLDGLV